MALFRVGGQICLDPGQLTSECTKVGLDTSSWEGLANSISLPRGKYAGTGYFLLLQRDFKKLDLTKKILVSIETFSPTTVDTQEPDQSHGYVAPFEAPDLMEGEELVREKQKPVMLLMYMYFQESRTIAFSPTKDDEVPDENAVLITLRDVRILGDLSHIHAKYNMTYQKSYLGLGMDYSEYPARNLIHEAVGYELYERYQRSKGYHYLNTPGNYPESSYWFRRDDETGLNSGGYDSMVLDPESTGDKRSLLESIGSWLPKDLALDLHYLQLYGDSDFSWIVDSEGNLIYEDEPDSGNVIQDWGPHWVHWNMIRENGQTSWRSEGSVFDFEVKSGHGIRNESFEGETAWDAYIEVLHSTGLDISVKPYQINHPSFTEAHIRTIIPDFNASKYFNEHLNPDIYLFKPYVQNMEKSDKLADTFDYGGIGSGGTSSDTYMERNRLQYSHNAVKRSLKKCRFAPEPVRKVKGLILSVPQKLRVLYPMENHTPKKSKNRPYWQNNYSYVYPSDYNRQEPYYVQEIDLREILKERNIDFKPIKGTCATVYDHVKAIVMPNWDGDEAAIPEGSKIIKRYNHFTNAKPQELLVNNSILEERTLRFGERLINKNFKDTSIEGLYSGYPIGLHPGYSLSYVAIFDVGSGIYTSAFSEDIPQNLKNEMYSSPAKTNYSYNFDPDKENYAYGSSFDVGFKKEKVSPANNPTTDIIPVILVTPIPAYGCGSAVVVYPKVKKIDDYEDHDGSNPAWKNMERKYQYDPGQGRGRGDEGGSVTRSSLILQVWDQEGRPHPVHYANYSHPGSEGFFNSEWHKYDMEKMYEFTEYFFNQHEPRHNPSINFVYYNSFLGKHVLLPSGTSTERVELLEDLQYLGQAEAGIIMSGASDPYVGGRFNTHNSIYTILVRDYLLEPNHKVRKQTRGIATFIGGRWYLTSAQCDPDISVKPSTPDSTPSELPVDEPNGTE